MGAKPSKKDDDTSMQDATTRGPITFDDATLNFVKGGPPPPPTETSTRLQSRCHQMFRRHTEKARTMEPARAMSTREALQAYKGNYGEAKAVEVFGHEEVYLASIKWDLTITGTAPRLHWLGPRTYAARSPHAQAIQALDAQRAGAAILAPSGSVVALDDDDDASRWAHLALVPYSDKRDDDLDFWERFVRSNNWPYQNLWDDGNWSGDAPPPDWGLIRSPSGRNPPGRAEKWYRGPLARDLKHQHCMTKDACGTDATMLEHWDRAAFYARRLTAILKKERKAFEAMRDKSEARGNNGGGRSRRGARRSHDPKNDYAALERAETDRLIREDPGKWYRRHHGSLTGQLARREPLLKAIANDAGVPRCVLTAEKGWLLSPVILVDLPGLGPNLVKGNYDHIDKGWTDDPSVAIRQLGFRRLTWDALNKKLPGYEHFIKDENAAERLYLDAYLNSALCFDRSFGGWFQLEFPINDEAKWWGKKTKDQQKTERHHILNHLLKGACLGATEGRADAAWNSST